MEDWTCLPPLEDLFFDIAPHDFSLSSGNMNEDGELFGRFCETPTTYTDTPDELAVSVLEEQNVKEDNNHSPDKEETSLSENLIKEVSLSKCCGWTTSCADVPIGLSSETWQTHHLNGCDESSPIHDSLIPRIMVTGTRASEAIHPRQPPLYTEGDDENIDEAEVPGGETAINKPYLQNPIVSHCGEGRDRRFLVWQSEEELKLQKSEWLTLY
ncbi:hypothetical protein PMAA_102760 [Talaromyces marneffei ATCC 18224]|uniref:Uncharacterized protein n=1 Tax=Talaromyces marneffei (strain ATCC 18224 / CBS 334.59 / QM 7333) TaxID=441960 RepID=B6QWL3_TALMQ|nr:hypothetical protein PMAA_102760 [Talaromyces marneffei ATCC 18224]